MRLSLTVEWFIATLGQLHTVLGTIVNVYCVSVQQMK